MFTYGRFPFFYNLFVNFGHFSKSPRDSDNHRVCSRGEREMPFVSWEREGKMKITFPFYGKGTGIRKCYGKGREI